MDTPPFSPQTNPSGETSDLSGVTISGQANVSAHDIIGRDKIIQGDVNTATVGEGARVGQIAVGTNITQILGITAAEVTLLLDKIRTEYQTKRFDGRSPYIGLASFQERDADKFFGRETLTAELVTRVAVSAVSNARAVFVAGPSGSGKSSLVRAGLIPALKKGNGAGSEHWLYETLKPGRAPLDELGLAVAKLARHSDLRSEMAARGFTDATFLNQQADMALTDDSKQRAVIVIDQFEEIFTQLLSERQAERVAFLNLLTHAATVEHGRVLVIFTLRSDFVSNCASYQNLNALVNQQFIQVGAMTPDELVSAIARPAYQVGLRIDPALISQIVNDVRGEPGALPLMQFALQDLFEAEKAKGELTLDGYVARGGLHEALERHADAEFAKLDPDEKQLARSVFSGLIEIGRGREDTKRTARFGELVPAGAEESRVQALVRELADARLITTDEQDGKETVTLAHERLIDAWDWLRKLVDENRDAIALQNEIAQDAQEWETHKHDESYLYRGARLATAQEKLQQNQLVLSGLAQEFVETALATREQERAEREAARQRELEQAQALAEEQKQRAEEQLAANERLTRRNLYLAGAFVLALVAVGAALLFLGQSNDNLQNANLANTATYLEAQTRSAAQANALSQAATANAEANRADEQARISESRRLAEQANLLRTENIDQSLLLGIEAVNAFDSVEALNTFFGAINPHAVTVFWGHTGPINSVTFSSDSMIIASGSDDNTIRLWDAASGSQIGDPLTALTSTVTSVAFSMNGKLLAAGGCAKSDSITCAAGEIRLWDVSNPIYPKPLDSRQTNANSVQSIVFHPNGSALVSTSSDGRVQLWNVKDAAHITLLGDALDERVNESSGVTFSPNGKFLAGVGGLYGTISLWDVSDVADPKWLDYLATNSEISSIAFGADSLTLAAGDTDGTIRLWDLHDPSHIVSLGSPLIGHTGAVSSIAFSQDGAVLASAALDRTILLWDVRQIQEPKLLDDPLIGHSKAISSIAFSRDGKTLVSGGEDNTVRLWKIANDWQLSESLPGAAGSFQTIAFSPDGQLLAAGATDPDYFRSTWLWNLDDGTHPKELDGLPMKELDLSWSVAFSPDGKTLATGNYATGIHMWHIETQNETSNPLAEYKGFIYALAFRPLTGNVLVWGGCAAKDVRGNCTEGELGFWDVENGKMLGALRAHKGEVHTLAFSRDGEIVASGGCAAKSANGNCTSGEILFWDVSSRQPVGRITGHTDTIWSIAFSPDGNLLASGSQDSSIRLWDVTSRNPVGVPLRGHSSAVNSVAFNVEGTILASSGDDGTTRLWQVSSQKPIAPPLKKNGEIPFGVVFSPDGKALATMSARAIQLWNIAAINLGKEKWLERACRTVNRNLTRAEWSRYLNNDPRDYETKYLNQPTCSHPSEKLVKKSPDTEDWSSKQTGANLNRHEGNPVLSARDQPFEIPAACGSPIPYTVQEGDSLYRIAINNGTVPQWIVNANALFGKALVPGMTLAIPCSGYVPYGPSIYTPTPGGPGIVTATPPASPGVGTAIPHPTPVPAITQFKMANGRFRPSSLTVKVGTTITWVNTESVGGAFYSVTSGRNGNHNGLFDSGPIQPGGTFQFTFTLPGSYPFYSATNPTSMTGEVIVIP